MRSVVRHPLCSNASDLEGTFIIVMAFGHSRLWDVETSELCCQSDGPGKAMLGSARECPILTWTSENPRLHVRSRSQPLVPSRGRRSGYRSRTRRPCPPWWVVGGAAPGPCPSPRGAQGNRGRPRREALKRRRRMLMLTSRQLFLHCDFGKREVLDGTKFIKSRATIPLGILYERREKKRKEGKSRGKLHRVYSGICTIDAVDTGRCRYHGYCLPAAIVPIVTLDCWIFAEAGQHNSSLH
jgi:hypothetical protein